MSYTPGITRRRALLSVGGLGLAASVTTVLGEPAAGVSKADVLATVQSYMRARTAAANPGGAGLAAAGMAAKVRSFESERAAFMRSLGAKSQYDGRILGLTSSLLNLRSVADADGTVQVSLYEQFNLDWVPNPRPRPDAVADELVKSGFGTPHLLRVARTARGWAVVSHAYAERDLYGTSPDVDQQLAVELSQVPSPTAPAQPEAARGKTSPQLDPPYNVYSRSGARDYAYGYALSYNPAYVRYDCQNVDCANFVSQALWAGGQTPAGAWQRVKTSNCGVQNKWGGNALEWYNNRYLQAWVVGTGRGATVGGMGVLQNGDLVNYDWAGGGTDHIAMVTNGAQNLVSCHTSDRQNVNWTLGGAASYTFTHLADHF